MDIMDNNMIMMLDETVNYFQDKIVEINAANGWREDYSGIGNPFEFMTLMALLHSEISEAVEEFRLDRTDLERWDAVMMEMADVFIRLLDTTERIEKLSPISLSEAIVKKLIKNKTRGYKHDNKQV